MIGDSRHMPLEGNSVNCIITSPPYWSLRKYDIPDLIWDGVEECEHEWGCPLKIGRHKEGETNPGKESWYKDKGQIDLNAGQFCLRCSAWRGQLGLEPTIDLYLKHLMQIMDECKRVLRDDGTMWVNLGDSYGGSGSPGGDFRGKYRGDDYLRPYNRGGVTAKSLCLIPERFAIEMVNRGWVLRNKIIWHKPNCMPSSVKDRFTVDFEPVFFFVKSRKYWFEQQYERNLCNEGYKHGTFGRKSLAAGKRVKIELNPQGRNRRCVWTIPTQPYPESHFATFPEALIEPMIRAGCPKEICVKCGKAREKIIEDGELEPLRGNSQALRKEGYGKDQTLAGSLQKHGWTPGIRHRTEVGLTDCGCNAGFRPGVVLDPFCGSGTTMVVAEKLNRVGVGFDLGYEDLQENRMKTIKKGLFVNFIRRKN